MLVMEKAGEWLTRREALTSVEVAAILDRHRDERIADYQTACSQKQEIIDSQTERIAELGNTHDVDRHMLQHLQKENARLREAARGFVHHYILDTEENDFGGLDGWGAELDRLAGVIRAALDEGSKS
jgi:hypothetical protein